MSISSSSDVICTKELKIEKGEAVTASIITVKDSIHSIKRNAMRFFSGTALSRVTGMIRDIILASLFGTTSSLAALLLAFRLSQTLRRLFGEGALQSALIPIFEEVRKESEERAFRFFRDLSALVSMILFTLVIAIMIGLGLALKFIHFSEANREVIFLMTIMMPSLIPICLYGVNMALLQCQKQYFTPSIAPAAFNIVIAVTALLFSYKEAKAAMPFVAIGIVIACTMQWAVTVPATFRHVRARLKGHLSEAINFFSQDIRRLLIPLSLGIIGVGATQINNAVDAIFARFASEEGPAYLHFGIRFIQLPLALFGIAIAGALLPPLARAIQNNNQEDYRHYLEYATRRLVAFLLPCSVLLLVFGTHIVNLVFGQDKFTTASVYNTSACLHAYALGLLPLGFINVFGPACYAHKDWKVPVIGSCICLVTNFVLNCIFILGLGFGAISAALATSISAWINIAYIYKHLQIRAGKIVSTEGVQEFFKVAVVSILAGLTTWIIQSHLWTPASFFTYNTSNLDLLSRSKLEQALPLLFSTITFLVSLLGYAYIARANDILGFVRRSKATA